MRRPPFQRQTSPSPSAVALTLAERAQLVQLAPAEQGDHVVSLQRTGQPEVFGVVRRDGSGPRLVAVALTASDAQEKARPVADRWAPVQPTGAGGSEPKATGANAQAQQRAAEASLDAERAEYRRACAAAGITAPKLV